jgi:CRISPR-associated protein (TIGR02710 family)
MKIISQLKEKTKNSGIQERLDFCEKICTAYSLWDKFNHDDAWKILKDIKHGLLAENKAFLGRLSTVKTKEQEEEAMPFYIADLINNAERRFHEGKYDDAVARLYRCIELIAQYELLRLGINSANVDVNKLPEELRVKYEELRDEDGKIQISLKKDFELLAEFGKDIGNKFLENKDLKNLLSARNYSILAHGLCSVEKETYSKLLNYVNEYTLTSISDIESLKNRAEFPSFEELHITS